MRKYLPIGLCLICGVTEAQYSTSGDEGLPIEALVDAGARIGEIEIDVDNVFDLSNPEEDRALYRWANRVHVPTRDATIQDALLIAPGEPFDPRLLEESARALRSLGFIAEAGLTPLSYDEAANEIAVGVHVRDAWSLTPEIKLSRSGGENEFALGLSEENFFGRGKNLTLAYSSDVDRNETYFGYSDPNVRGTRTRLNTVLANRSDGDRKAFEIVRPFYALDSRWSVGSAYDNDSRIDSMYELGEVFDEFRHDTSAFSIRGGWSGGLKDNRVHRWLVGIDYEEDSFRATVETPDPLLLPEDRKLVYPWFGVEIIDDRFLEVSELNDMGRTEDIQLGLGFSARIGLADTSYGADRDAKIVSIGGQKGWELGGSGSLLLVDGRASARIEDEGTQNAIASTRLRYYLRNMQRHLFSASLMAVSGRHLDAENQVLIGGDNGLRGFPLRYQSGERSLTLTVEQRFFTDWYPFRLIRVGYAVFFDAGRVWGADARSAEQLGTLYDLGIGLRLTSPRSTGSSVIHIDLAFPVNGDPEIDDIQLTIEKKRSF